MSKHTEVKMPELLSYWTVDEVAECIDGIGSDIYRKLWSFITPETDGKDAPLAEVAWGTFTDEEKAKVAAAIAKDFPED
ncbi:hypothetical protein PVT16_004621 [Klebsiella pneumoniae]